MVSCEVEVASLRRRLAVELFSGKIGLLLVIS